MSGLEPMMIAATVASAGATFMQYQATVDAGKAERQLYEAKAYEAKIQGRKDALNYKEQGIKVLQDINKTMATVNARAGSGNMNPYATGDTSDILMGYTLREGVNDFTIARDNSTIAQQMGNYQAANYRVAGKNAEMIAKKKATGDALQSVAKVGFMYG
tara:strand:+ start:268 stop:744 length:477 start_codon:yes stop_codon:yes gene_type:complete